MTGPDAPQLPIFTFDSNDTLETFESLDDLEAHIEPLFVEEVKNAYDREARPIRLAVVDGVGRAVVASPASDLAGVKSSVAAVPWILASDLPAGEVSVNGYIEGLLNAYGRAVERDAQKRGWRNRFFKPRD